MKRLTKIRLVGVYMLTCGVIGLATACGYSSINNEVIAQVKKVTRETPIICPDRVDVDLSLGVMRNGVGSMSTQDVWLTVPADEAMRRTLTEAASTGALVKVFYDHKRFVWCGQQEIVKAVEIVR